MGVQDSRSKKEMRSPLLFPRMKLFPEGFFHSLYDTILIRGPLRPKPMKRFVRIAKCKD